MSYLIRPTKEGVNSNGVHIPRSECRTSSHPEYFTKEHAGDGISTQTESKFTTFDIHPSIRWQYIKANNFYD